MRHRIFLDRRNIFSNISSVGGIFKCWWKLLENLKYLRVYTLGCMDGRRNLFEITYNYSLRTQLELRTIHIFFVGLLGSQNTNISVIEILENNFHFPIQVRPFQDDQIFKKKEFLKKFTKNTKYRMRNICSLYMPFKKKTKTKKSSQPE